MEEDRRSSPGGCSCRRDYQQAQYLERKATVLQAATAKQLEEAVAAAAGIQVNYTIKNSEATSYLVQNANDLEHAVINLGRAVLVVQVDPKALREWQLESHEIKNSNLRHTNVEENKRNK